MRKKLTALAVGALAMTAFAACGDDDDDLDTPTEDDGTELVPADTMVETTTATS